MSSLFPFPESSAIDGKRWSDFLRADGGLTDTAIAIAGRYLKKTVALDPEARRRLFYDASLIDNLVDGYLRVARRDAAEAIATKRRDANSSAATPSESVAGLLLRRQRALDHELADIEIKRHTLAVEQKQMAQREAALRQGESEIRRWEFTHMNSSLLEARFEKLKSDGEEMREHLVTVASLLEDIIRKNQYDLNLMRKYHDELIEWNAILCGINLYQTRYALVGKECDEYAKERVTEHFKLLTDENLDDHQRLRAAGSLLATLLGLWDGPHGRAIFGLDYTIDSMTARCGRIRTLLGLISPYNKLRRKALLRLKHGIDLPIEGDPSTRRTSFKQWSRRMDIYYPRLRRS